MAKVKALITGGAGFIGSHLCETLLRKGYLIICVDNLITGSKENIEGFLDKSRFKFIKHDVTKQFSNKAIEQFSNLDFIYHLASPASPKKYQKYPLETLLVNSIGTYNLLRLAQKNKAKFLYTSSSEVYGDPTEHPQKESYWGNVNQIGSRSCYDEAKRFGEAITVAFVRKHNLNARIVRIFNTYGPRMEEDDGRVISNFISQAIKEEPLTVYGNGLQTRSFCFISDMTEGLIKAMEGVKTVGEVFNLGNPDEWRILEIAKLVKQITKSNSKITFTTLPEDDPHRRKPNIEKAKRFLGWTPKVKLKGGLKETINYFRSIIE